MCWWKPKATPVVTPRVMRQTTRRERTSPRGTTTVASSPCWRRRGSRRMRLDRVVVALAADRSRSPHGLFDRRRPRQFRLVVLPGHGVLELTHPPPHGAAHLRQPLRPEDEENDDKQDQQLPRSNPPWHAPSLAA